MKRYTQAAKYGSIAVLLAAGQAHAVIDITAATAGVSDAGVALLALLGAMIALSASIFGVGKVYSFLRKKAGA